MDTPALLSEIQNGLPLLVAMPQGLTNWGSIVLSDPWQVGDQVRLQDAGRQQAAILEDFKGQRIRRAPAPHWPPRSMPGNKPFEGEEARPHGVVSVQEKLEMNTYRSVGDNQLGVTRLPLRGQARFVGIKCSLFFLNAMRHKGVPVAV